jgi:penicillin-binding protein 1A
MFGKTGTTSGPTNVWFVGGTPDIVAGVYLGYDQPRSMGGYAQGGRIAAPIFKQWALASLQDQPKTPFVAPPGIRWVRVDRATGKRVFGVFPTKDDPKAQVIWEAFQPQTEPRRSYRRSQGDPYEDQRDQQQASGDTRSSQPRAVVRRPRAAPSMQPPAATGLPTQNGVY